MNPFTTAQAFGHSAEDILKFSANAIPGLEDKIKYALAAGYAADEVLKFLQNSFQGKIPKSMTKRSSGDDRSAITKSMGPHEPDPVMQMKAFAKQRNIGDLLDPGRLALTAGGAAAGFAMGGPMGAAAGAYGGNAAHEEMLKKYEEHIQEGGQMSFEDYLKSLMKGGAKGVGAYAAASQVPKVLAALQAGKAESGGTDSPAGQIEQGQAQAAGTLQAGTPQDLQGMGPEESFKALEAENLGLFMQRYGTKLVQKDFIDYLRSQIGKAKFKALGDKHGRPAEEIVGQAWEFIQAGSQQPPEGPQGVQQPPQIQQGTPTEQSVETDTLAEMAGGPGVAINSLDESVNRDVKQLDIGERDESFLADIFHNIFAEPEYPTAPSDKKRTVAPLANALKSSNVRGGQWDSQTGEMRIIFQPTEGTPEGGAVYTYPNVDKKAWEDLTGGKATPLTEGSNIFGFWDRGKSKSIGAAFSAKIKKNADNYPPTKLAEENITVGENQIRTADRVFMVSDLFAPFKKVRMDGRRKMKSSDLNQWVKDYADYSSEDIFEMIEMVEENLKGELKNYPSDARLKKEITSKFGVTFNPTEKEKEKLAAKEAKKKEQLAKKAAREAAKKRKKG